MGPNCTKYYLISRKEYILCTATFPNPTLYDTSKPICTLEKGSSNHTLSLSLSAPIAPDADSTLLLLLPRNTQSFSVVSRDWLDLQEVLQNLFLLHEKKETRDYMTEALAQKLTRVGSSSRHHHQIFVQDGVLVPRYYNVYRKTPEDNIYWKWSPLSSSIGTLRTLYPLTPQIESLLRSICEHLQHEPSAFIFQNPVDAAVGAPPRFDSQQFPTYREIITQPMDLSTVLKRVNCGYYSRYGRFHADLHVQPMSRHLVPAMRGAEAVLHEHLSLSPDLRPAAGAGEQSDGSHGGEFHCEREKEGGVGVLRERIEQAGEGGGAGPCGPRGV